jgi:hypothetical protein
VVGFVLTFAPAYVACRVWRDASIYAAVRGKNPPELRVYLADPQNTLYRTDVVAQLKSMHDNLAAALEKQNGDPLMKKALAELIRGVHDSPAPTITMAFDKGDAKDPNSMEGILGPLEAAAMSGSRIKQLGEGRREKNPGSPEGLPDLFDRIGDFRNNQNVGRQIVAFEEVPGDSFAMIQISVKVDKPDPDAATRRIVWTVRFQRSPSAEPVTVAWTQPVFSDDEDALRRQFRKSCEDFPRTFMTYLQTMPIPAGVKP